MRIIILQTPNNARIKTSLRVVPRELFSLISINKINLRLHSKNTSMRFWIFFFPDILLESRILLSICMDKRRFCSWVRMRTLPILSIGRRNTLGFVVRNGGNPSSPGRVWLLEVSRTTGLVWRLALSEPSLKAFIINWDWRRKMLQRYRLEDPMEILDPVHFPLMVFF